MRSLTGRIAAGLGYGFVFVGSHVQAQSNSTAAEAGVKLEEIIVTAERRETDMQSTAAAVSVRTGEEMAEQGRITLGDVLRDVPNVTGGDITGAATGGSDNRGNSITIRGISGSPAGGGSGGPVSGSSTTALYVDGIYEGIGGDYDLARVEVVRGPQGTLYGRSATGGVVAQYTRDPDFDGVNGNASIQVESHTRRAATAGINIPFGEKFAVRVAGRFDKRNEGVRNHDEGDAYEKQMGRIKALYAPTDDLSILFGMAFEEIDQNTGGYSGESPVDGVVTYHFNLVNPTHNHSRQYWLKADWDLGPVVLTYQPTFRTYYQTAVSDADGPYNGGMRQTIVTPDDDFITHELRLTSKSGSALTWQTGLFYYDNKITSSNGNVWRSGALLFDTDTTRKTNNYGIFGEGTYAFTEASRLTLGLRYDYAKVNTNQIYTVNANFLCNVAGAVAAGVTPDTCSDAYTSQGEPELNSTTVVNENTTPSGVNTWRKVNYKVRYEHDLSSHNMLYAVVSTGFIPGDISVSTDSGASVTIFDAEVLTAYEMGTKNRFLDERLQVNAAVFYYDWGGYQQSIERVPGVPTTSYTTTVPAKMRGLELETQYLPTPNDRIGLNYSYLDAWYVDKPADFAAVYPWKKRGVVPHTLNANYEHTFKLANGSNLSARIEGTWIPRYQRYFPVQSIIDQGGNDETYTHTDSEVTSNFNMNWLSPGGHGPWVHS